jgi:peroxiredoxin
MARLEAGQPAPDFSLEADDGSTVDLASLRGSTVALYFYPKDDTTGCTAQACEFRDMKADYDAAGVRVVGVSPDPLKSHTKFRDKYELPFTLLSDPDHEGRRGLWRVGREVHVRAHLHGHRAQHLRHRPRRDPEGGALQGEAEGPRGVGARAGLLNDHPGARS